MAESSEFYRLTLALDMQDRLTAKMSRVDSKVKQVEDNFKRTEKAIDRLGNARAEPKVEADTAPAEQKINRLEQMFRKIDAFVSKPKVDADDKASGKATKVQSRLRTLTEKAWQVTLSLKDNVSGKLSSIKNGLTGPAAMLGIGAATAGIGGFVVDSAQKAMDFSYQISNIKALTNMGDTELEQVRKKALDLGAATQFSSTEAAQGMTELLKAGMSVEQVMNGATDAALNLAAAGELSLPEAAEIMSTAMNAFHMDDAAHAADILAGAANASATDVHELKYALSAVSSVAAGVGMSFDDTNTALAVFAQNGLKGSDAGTSLKTMLMRLEPTTKEQYEAFQRLGLMTENGTSAFYDAEGRMKSLAEIADLLSTSMKDLNPEEQQSLLNSMFGSDAIRGGMIMIREGAAGVKKMQEEMTKYTASDVAKTKWENAKGDVVRLQSAFQNFQITALAPLEPAIGKVAKALTDFFGANADGAAEQVGKLSERISNFVDALGDDDKFQAMDWGDKIVYVLDKMMDAIDEWASGSGGQQFGRVMTKLAEIGMRAFLAALVGLFKGSLSALFSGNFVGAAGLALGGAMLGGGKLLGGVIKGGSALGKLALGGEKGAAIYSDALALAKENGSGSIMSRLEAARFTAEVSPIGRAMKWIGESKAGSLLGKAGGAIAKPLAMIGDVYDLATSDNKAQTAGGIAGHWAGTVAGAKMGAAAGGAIGSAFAGVGAAPGAAIGGVLGSIGGFFAGDKLGEMVGNAFGNIDFGAIKERLAQAFDFSDLGATISEGLSEAGTSIEEFFDTLPERAGYAAGYIVQTLSDLPGQVSEYFSQLVEDASTYISELPSRVGDWLSQTAATASAIASEVITGVVQWFEQLPANVSAKMSELYSTVSNWCSQTIASISSWFSQIPGIIGGFFDSAIATVKNKAASAWSYVSGIGARFSAGFGQGQQAAGVHFAYGGFVDRETLATVAEGGRLEAIIPMDPGKRERGLSLWQQAGQMLGVDKDLFANVGRGGGFEPALAGAGGGTFGGSTETRTGDSYNFNGMNINIGNNMSEEDMALAIGRRILAEIKQGFQNRG